MILDTAGQKGTGKWTSQNALDLGVPLADHQRSRGGPLPLSAMKDERVAASASKLPAPAMQAVQPATAPSSSRPSATRSTPRRSCLRAGLRSSCARRRGVQVGAELRRHRHALARRLHHPRPVPGRDHEGLSIRIPKLENLMLDAVLHRRHPQGPSQLAPGGCRRPAARHRRPRVQLGAWPITTATAARALPANLLQAQRDYFGAHTYERVDKEGTFHFQWME